MSDTRETSLDGKTFAIGVLSVTACILFVGLMLINTQPAQAFGQSDKAGDYKMLTMQLGSSRECIVVVDAAAKQAIIYGFNNSQDRLDILSMIPMDQMPKPRDPDVSNQPRGRNRR